MSLVSEKEQNVRVVVPSEIKNISIEGGNGQIEETGNRNDRIISLSEDELVTIHLDI